MWPFRKRAAASHGDELNQLVTRVERLEADNAERQLLVLSSVEKVLHQLRARFKKRLEDEPPEAVDVDSGTQPANPLLLRRRQLRGY